MYKRQYILEDISIFLNINYIKMCLDIYDGCLFSDKHPYIVYYYNFIYECKDKPLQSKKDSKQSSSV